MALHLYHEAKGMFPPGYGLVNATEGWAWSAFILPYMEQANISDRIDYTHSFNEYVSPNNTLLKTILPFYQCPSAAPVVLVPCCAAYVAHDGSQQVAGTDYAGIATHTQAQPDLCGKTSTGSGCLYVNSRVSIADIKDGTSYTLMIGERMFFPDNDPQKTGWSACPGGVCDFGDNWAGVSRITTYYGINNPSATYYDQSSVQSRHPGGSTFNFADGHVAYLSENIRLNVLWGS